MSEVAKRRNGEAQRLTETNQLTRPARAPSLYPQDVIWGVALRNTLDKFIITSNKGELTKQRH